MARGLSKNRRDFSATIKQSPASSEPAVQSSQSTSFRITSVEFSAGTVFLLALILYSWTLAPTVTLTDSGELIVVAQWLGIAHPPGVPLWTILAHLASRVPFGNVAVRINFSSALFAAVACAMLTLAVAELIITVSYLTASKRRKRGAQRSKPGDQPGFARLLLIAPAMGAGLLMAFSHTLWSYATITEVYALNTLL